MAPMISVIVPVYKAEKYLDKCIGSIVNQTYKNLEIILVDDASPDNCPKMCDEWAKKDSRIKVFHIENKGVANARNFALSYASGDYIAFVDSDDYIESDMYEKLTNIISQGNNDIAVCDYQINDEDCKADNTSIINAYEALCKIAIGSYKFGVLWNKLYKKEILNGIKMPDLCYSEDLVFNFFAFQNAKTVAITDLKLYHYYQNEYSAVHNDFNISKYDAVRARKIILDCCQDDLKEYAVYGYVLSCYVFLNQIISENKLTEMLSELRLEILKYKNTIFKSNHFSKNDKLKTFLLLLSTNLYKFALKILK